VRSIFKNAMRALLSTDENQLEEVRPQGKLTSLITHHWQLK
jgi:hypothetical protein